LFYIIYKITNKVNNKFYIGKHQTKKLDDGYMGSGKLIKAAIKKYGSENFIKEILHIYDNEKDMNFKEKEMVVISEDSYNLCDGGKGGFGYINRSGKNLYGKNGNSDNGGKNLLHGKEFIEVLKHKNIYEKWRKSISIGVKNHIEQNGHNWLGKKHKPESKKLIGSKNSINQKGSRNSQYGTCWITNGKENKKIKKEEIDKYIELGFSKGRKQL
jgi:hypothetical protein